MIAARCVFVCPKRTHAGGEGLSIKLMV